MGGQERPREGSRESSDQRRQSSRNVLARGEREVARGREGKGGKSRVQGGAYKARRTETNKSGRAGKGSGGRQGRSGESRAERGEGRWIQAERGVGEDAVGCATETSGMSVA